MPSFSVYKGRVHLFDYEITKSMVIVGRSQRADIPLDSEAVSRMHTRIHRRGLTFVAEDLGTANGMFVNGKRTQKATLSHGDQIEIAQHYLVFERPKAEVDRERDERDRVPGAGFRMTGDDVSRAMSGKRAGDARDYARQVDGLQKTAMVSEETMLALRASMARRRQAHLAFLIDGRSHEVPLDDEFLVLGWDRDSCDVKLPTPNWFIRALVKEVAELEPGKRKGQVVLRSLSRLVPVRMKGERVREHELKDGDTFQIAGIKFRYRAAMG